MSASPILFSGPMVRSILAGTKTQTRRVVKPQPEFGRACWGGALDDVNVFRTRNKTGGWHHCDPTTFAEIYSPYGQPGDQLYVRETTCIAPKHFAPPDETCVKDYDGDPRYVSYKADGHSEDAMRDYKLKWTPSIHVPRWASRITLEITGVRVERVQDISEADAVAEGIRRGSRATSSHSSVPTYWDYLRNEPGYRCPRSSYSSLWESINGPGSWDENPWVWVVEFKRVEVQP